MNFILRSVSCGLLAVVGISGVCGAKTPQMEDLKVYDGVGFDYEGEISKSLAGHLKTYIVEFSGGRTADLQSYMLELQKLMQTKGKVASDYRFYGYKNETLMVDDLADLMSGAKPEDTFKGIISYRVLVSDAPEKSSK